MAGRFGYTRRPDPTERGASLGPLGGSMVNLPRSQMPRAAAASIRDTPHLEANRALLEVELEPPVSFVTQNGYVYWIFGGDGEFRTTGAVTVDILIIGGGGGGGGGPSGGFGGGGAGGVVEVLSFDVEAGQAIPVYVGQAGDGYSEDLEGDDGEGGDSIVWMSAGGTALVPGVDEAPEDFTAFGGDLGGNNGGDSGEPTQFSGGSDSDVPGTSSAGGGGAGSAEDGEDGDGDTGIAGGGGDGVELTDWLIPQAGGGGGASVYSGGNIATTPGVGGSSGGGTGGSENEDESNDPVFTFPSDGSVPGAGGGAASGMNPADGQNFHGGKGAPGRVIIRYAE